MARRSEQGAAAQPRRRGLGLAGLAAAAVILAGCADQPAHITTSTEPVAPITPAASPTGTAPTTSSPAPPSTTAPPSATTSAPPTHTAPASSSAPPTAPSSAPPGSTSPPPEQVAVVCPDNDCPDVSHSVIKNNERIVLRQGRDPAGDDNVTVVELTRDGQVIDWDLQPDTYEPKMTCSSQTEHLHCVVTWGVGAHASVAQLYIVENGRLVKPGLISTDTPGIIGIDLDNDGDLDLLVPINDNDPSYAGGSFYWETMELSDGKYEATGCTPKSRDIATAPTSLLDGGCPTG